MLVGHTKTKIHSSQLKQEMIPPVSEPNLKLNPWLGLSPMLNLALSSKLNLALSSKLSLALNSMLNLALSPSAG